MQHNPQQKKIVGIALIASGVALIAFSVVLSTMGFDKVIWIMLGVAGLADSAIGFFFYSKADRGNGGT